MILIIRRVPSIKKRSNSPYLLNKYVSLKKKSRSNKRTAYTYIHIRFIQRWVLLILFYMLTYHHVYHSLFTYWSAHRSGQRVLLKDWQRYRYCEERERRWPKLEIEREGEVWVKNLRVKADDIFLYIYKLGYQFLNSEPDFHTCTRTG